MNESLQLLTSAEVAKLCNAHENQVNMWRDTGILKGIKTSRGWAYIPKEIEKFQSKFNGYDISNPKKVYRTLEEMKENEVQYGK